MPGIEKMFSMMIEPPNNAGKREAKRVRIFMDDVNQKEKAIIFCATQDHASVIRDLVNQYKKIMDANAASFSEG